MRTVPAFVVVIGVLLAACSPAPLPAWNPPAAPALTPGDPAVAPVVPVGTPRGKPGTALAALAALPSKGRAPKTGYARAQFGTAWQDTDGNRCDQRNDVLRRDLASVTPTLGCQINTGVLHDPYTGRDVTFVRGIATSTAVEIDHVVSLSNAWQTGAQQLTQDQRLAFATDARLNLLAVDGPTNQAKGDGDAATWLPPAKAFRCAYVARQIAVKTTYRLWLTVAERDAMQRVLAACPEQPLPTGGGVRG